MKTKFLFIVALFISARVFAETSLVVQPLTGDEQAKALASIGYVKVTPDSLFIYSHGNMLLSKNAINDIRHIRYGEPAEATSIDNVNVSTCRIYPNPTQDMLIIDGSNADKALIFDLNGRLLQTVTINGEHATINVTSLPQGDYILLLNTQTYKFIKH